MGAGKAIEAAIDEHPNWEFISKRLAGQLRPNLEIGRDRALVQNAFLTAELELEWTDASSCAQGLTAERPRSNWHDQAVITDVGELPANLRGNDGRRDSLALDPLFYPPRIDEQGPEVDRNLLRRVGNALGPHLGWQLGVLNNRLPG